MLHKAACTTKAATAHGTDSALAAADAAADSAFANIGTVYEAAAAHNQVEELTDMGAQLHDLLGEETDIRQARTAAMQFLDAVASGSGMASGGQSEHDHMERSIRQAIDQARDSVTTLERAADDAEADRKALDSQVEAKQAELERLEKRLASLAHARPAFMDEYERLEEELADEYAAYVARFRNLTWLESQVAVARGREAARSQAGARAAAKLQQQLRQKELEQFRGGEEADDLDFDEDDMAGRAGGAAGQEPQRRDAGSRQRQQQQQHAGADPGFRAGRGAPLDDSLDDDDDDDLGDSELDEDFSEGLSDEDDLGEDDDFSSDADF